MFKKKTKQMKFNSVFLKWTTVRSKVTWCDAIGRRLWTAGDMLERAASGSSLQTASFPSFRIKDEVLESDSWGTSCGHLIFSIQTFFLHRLLLSFFFPGSVCCVTQGTILYQPRCSHCICQGLILVTNLVQVCLWFSWNGVTLGINRWH